MITNFNIFEYLDKDDTFKNTLLKVLDGQFSKINSSIISPNSFVKTGKDHLSISLQHIEDVETMVTFNIYRDDCSIWYAECNIKIDKNNSPRILESLLRGEYYTEDYFIGSSKLFSITKSSHAEVDDCIISYSVFYKLILFFKKNMIQQSIVRYRSFFE